MKNKKISWKKSKAILQTVGTICLILVLNSLIEYLKTPNLGHYTFVNPTKLEQKGTQEKVSEVIDTTEPEEEEVWLTGEFTAYTPSEDETDEDPWTNASGNRTKVGDVACPKSMKFGTKIEVRGHGTFECWDRMNQRYRDKANFDIVFMEKAEAFDFGRKDIEYRIVDNS